MTLVHHFSIIHHLTTFFLSHNDGNTTSKWRDLLVGWIIHL